MKRRDHIRRLLFRHRRRTLAVVGIALLATALLLVIILAGVGFSRAHLASPPATLWLTDRNGHFLGAVSGEADGRLGFWPVGHPLWRAEAALLAIEDRNFWDHSGVDPLAVARAAGQNLLHGRRISGASTIAMQVARMQRPADRTWSAKLTEASTALALVARYGRRALLQHYLQLAPYGNEVHGIAFAARWYFDKPVEDLSWAEVVFLTALPQAPGLMNPYTERGRRRARERAVRILDALVAQGRLSGEEASDARKGLEILQIRARPAREPATLHALLALASALQGDPPASPRIRSTLDLDVQRMAVAEVEALVRDRAADGVQNGALLVVDLADQSVLAAVGSGGFNDDTPGGALDFTRIRRSPGSTLKPFIYALALQDGLIEATTPLDDLQRARDGIGNADGRFLGPLLPAAALGNSRNVPAVALVEQLGVERVFALFRRLGLHHQTRLGDGYGLGLALGGLPVRMVDLAHAMTTLAGDGRLRPLRWRMEAPQVEGDLVFTPEIARQIAGFLSDGPSRLPTFTQLAHLPFPVAIKTGTSAGWRDGWAVAWTRRYLVVAWAGRPDGRPMRRVGGAQVADEVAVDLLQRLHPDAHLGLDDVGFPPPAGWHSETVCALSGHAATPACDRLTTVWRSPDAGPLPRCTTHVQLEVDGRTGALAGPETAPAFRERRSFVDLPGRYADWMAQNGLRAPPGRPRDPNPLQQGRAPKLRITSPRNGAEVLRDPEAPLGLGTLALTVAVDPPGAEVLWSIDGVPFALVGPPYSVRWPLEPGEHFIEARVPYTNVRDVVKLVAR